jgi:hypothetical protein
MGRFLVPAEQLGKLPRAAAFPAAKTFPNAFVSVEFAGIRGATVMWAWASQIVAFVSLRLPGECFS